jgi:hypothetical protein
VRFAPQSVGRFTFRTISSDPSNQDLHGRTGTLQVAPYNGQNPLYLHRPVRVAADHRHFEHADATPFFWLGDTWWMGLCKRLRWPQGFQLLVADRVRKGFSEHKEQDAALQKRGWTELGKYVRSVDPRKKQFL